MFHCLTLILRLARWDVLMSAESFVCVAHENANARAAELKLRDHFHTLKNDGRASAAALPDEVDDGDAFATTLDSESFLPVATRSPVDYYVCSLLSAIVPGLLIVLLSAIPFACITGQCARSASLLRR